VNPDYPNVDPVSYLSWVERTAVRLGHGPETVHASTPLHPRVRKARARALKNFMLDQALKTHDRILGGD
jgi:hypothetical protein